MRDVRRIDIGRLLKNEEEVYLCFEEKSSAEKEGRTIKAYYGNEKFFTTIYETKDIDSIMLLHLRNDENGYSYEMRRPEISLDADFVSLDLIKELTAMGLQLEESNENNQDFLCYQFGNQMSVGKYGYYKSEMLNVSMLMRYYLKCYFSYSGVKIGNSLVTKIEISTYDGIENEILEPLYEFLRTIMDDLSAVNRYTEKELVELLTKHVPVSMHMDIWCKDKLIRASIDDRGPSQRSFCREDIVDGVINSNSSWIKTENPLELVVKELGL